MDWIDKLPPALQEQLLTELLALELLDRQKLHDFWHKWQQIAADQPTSNKGLL
jgi:hypothetical protein